ncbi:MAG TPA: heat-inducible transcriptional repressor HrcA [Candidatus Binatia bacterium]|nr:heat-inducible transcriptional repressor HrcA [Candidatus Binatia bacterium]
MIERRHREILADVVRTFIETGEPVSSRSISRRHAEHLSAATVRNVMADLEDEGYLCQPHTSAGRVPTSAGFRFFVQHVAEQPAQLSEQDREWIHRELSGAATPEEVMERASHVLASVTQGMGIVISPSVSQMVMEHVRFIALPDGRVVVVLVSAGGMTRDKVVRVPRPISTAELDRTAEMLNTQYRGWTLQAIRSHLRQRLERDRERYDQLGSNALLLCDPQVLGEDEPRELYVEGAAQVATAAGLAGPEEVRSLLQAIEERSRLVDLLTSCIEAPEPVHVEIGVRGMDRAGARLALVTAPYAWNEPLQGSLGILGPMRMHYERAITTVACVAQYFNGYVSGSRTT